MVFVGASSERDLAHLMGMRTAAGENGGGGSGQKRRGRNGHPRNIGVPLGTVIWEKQGTEIQWAGELVNEGDTVIGARGGQGGSGNTRFRAATNRTPQLAEEGLGGEQKEIVLEDRMKIDVAMIGKPNVGKSQLLRAISPAKPEVANYPYTTTEPAPAVVTRVWKEFVIAELPGILPGASQGNSRGSSFLRHLWRARVVVHLLDGSAEDPVKALEQVNAEMVAFEASFLQKPQLVVVNKIDLPEVNARIPALRRQLASLGVARHFISAQMGEGTEEMVEHLFQMLEETPPTPGPALLPVVVPTVSQMRLPEPQVVMDGQVFVVLSPQAERLVRLPDLRRFGARLQLHRAMVKMGIVKALEEAGVQTGDTVRIGSVEMQWE